MQPASRRHVERHFIDRIGWLRAAVLGANDGLLSTSSLIVGVASAASDHRQVLLAGMAGLTAGAMSMAAGEYVSVSSQADTEAGDLAKEKGELAARPDAEIEELTGIYVDRGLDRGLARKVALQLMAKDALEAHARDELGISDAVRARPVQAALASAASFAAGAALPLAVSLAAPTASTSWAVGITSLGGLAVLGALGAQAGGAAITRAVIRVTLWGGVAMAVTAAAGKLVGAQV